MWKTGTVNQMYWSARGHQVRPSVCSAGIFTLLKQCQETMTLAMVREAVVGAHQSENKTIHKQFFVHQSRVRKCIGSGKHLSYNS